MRLDARRVGALSLLVASAFLVTVKSEIRVQEREERSRPRMLSVNISPVGSVAIADPSIEVFKRNRQLILYSAGRVVKTYSIGLGFSPEGPKLRQGDGRTPEGKYYVCSKNSKSQFFLSLGLSYPNETDASRGLKDGLITRPQYQQIIAALRRGGVPLWNTPLGGEIFIHGSGSSTDWTWGCVALENQDIQELFNSIPKGTPVTIRP